MSRCHISPSYEVSTTVSGLLFNQPRPLPLVFLVGFQRQRVVLITPDFPRFDREARDAVHGPRWKRRQVVRQGPASVNLSHHLWSNEMEALASRSNGSSMGSPSCQLTGMRNMVGCCSFGLIGSHAICARNHLMICLSNSSFTPPGLTTLRHMAHGHTHAPGQC